MALTAAEEAELAALEKESTGAGNLTPEEEQELALLEGNSPAQPQLPKIENEMHPEMTGLKGLKVRTVYKALGADPDASFNYLQKQFPELEFSKDKSGEVIVQTRGDASGKAYRLDPTGFDVRDVTDLAYDIPAGVAQGVATAASGLAGAPAGGIGAIPAAMAGSAASGVALEALRNQLGQFMGIDQSQSADDLAMAGGAGLVSPLLFGTGAGVAQAGKAALKSGAKQTAEEILSTQRGLLGRAYDTIAGYVGPKLANLAGGESPAVIKKAASMLQEIKTADKNPEVFAKPLEQAGEQVSKKIREQTTKTGQRLNEIREMIDTQPGIVLAGEGATKAQGSIDAKPFVAPFQDLIADLERRASTDADKANIEELKSIIQGQFNGMPEFMTAAQVEGKMQHFKELAEEYGKKYGNTGSTKSSSVAGISGRVADAFESARKKMNEGIIQRLEAMDTGLAQEYSQTRSAYGELIDIADAHKNNFKNAQGVKNFLNRAMNDDVAANDLEKIQALTGVDLEDLAVRSQAIKTFSKPSTEVRALGRSNTARQVGLGVLGGTAGYYAAQQSGGEYSPFLMAAMGGYAGTKAASPAAIRKYMEMNSLMRQAPAQLPGYQMMPYTLINANKNDQEK
jgi:hypothetical protein